MEEDQCKTCIVLLPLDGMFALWKYTYRLFCESERIQISIDCTSCVCAGCVLSWDAFVQKAAD